MTEPTATPELPTRYIANPITIDRLRDPDYRAGVRAEWEAMAQAGDYEGARALAFNLFVDVIDYIGIVATERDRLQAELDTARRKLAECRELLGRVP